MIDRVLQSLRALRLHPVEHEFEIHDAMAEQFRVDGIQFSREVKLGPGCRVDFFVHAGGVAVEVKKGKPNRAQLEAQVSRYAAFPDVQAVVMVVERSLFGYPEKVNGKPVHYVGLNRQWGVAL